MRKYSLPVRVAAEVTTSLPADVALPKGSGAYKVLSECPEEFARRELSDEEIQALAQGDQEVVLDCKDELYTPRSPWGIQEFFRDDSLAADLAEQKVAHIKPENIGNYVLSTKLGGTTLTPEEAYALLDMEPEQVKERVKTAADVLMLMLAGQYSDCHGDRNITIDGNIWHYNLNAFQVMQTRTTNCGSAANLANYLLEGDYEEIGFILHAYYIGDGGGHVYNYFKYQGKYYIVDFSSY